MDKSNLELEHEAFEIVMNEYKEAIASGKALGYLLEIKSRLDNIREQYMNSLMATMPLRKAA
jgi:hypothetical protein